MLKGGMAATSVVPLMRYRNCAEAVGWLVRAFGFERHFVVGSDDNIVYAQLTCGNGMVMIGPVGESDLDAHLKQPDEIGGLVTQSCYLAIDDVDAHYARAKQNGAEIILELTGAPFGSRGYSCRDIEGHVWNFGSYDPWRGKRLPDAPAQAKEQPRRTGIVGDLVALGLCLAALAVALSPLGSALIASTAKRIEIARSPETALRSGSAAPAGGTLPKNSGSPANPSANVSELEQAMAATLDKLTQSGARITVIEAELASTRLDLDRERAAKERAEQGATAAIERIAADVRRELDSEKAAREQIEQRLGEAQSALQQERQQREAAVAAAGELTSRLSVETEARSKAERAAHESKDQLQDSIGETKSPGSSASVTTGSTAPLSEPGLPAGEVNRSVIADPSAVPLSSEAKLPGDPSAIGDTMTDGANGKAREGSGRSSKPKRSRDSGGKAKVKKVETATKPYKAKPKPPKKPEPPIMNVL